MSETTPTPANVWGPPSGPVVVSVASLAVFVIALGIAWWSKDPSLQVLLGMAGANSGAVVQYWLGSSSSSKGKDATIAAVAMGQPAAGDKP